MKKNIIIIISTIVIIILMGTVLLFLRNDKPITTLTDDEIKFKNEFEKFNLVQVNNEELITLNIDDDNNVIYANDNNIIDLLTKDTNIIYFGYAESNECRKALQVLLKTLKEEDIDKLYYYNIKELIDSLDNEKSKELYNKIIEVIGEDVLANFEEEDKLDLKKIIMPTIVFIKDGKYIGLYSNNNEIDNDDLDEYIKQNYIKHINMLNPNVCTTDEGC